MKKGEIRRFLNCDVVGQRSNGLFFEGRVDLRAGKTVVVDRESGSPCWIEPREIRWMAKPVRYC